MWLSFSVSYETTGLLKKVQWKSFPPSRSFCVSHHKVSAPSGRDSKQQKTFRQNEKLQNTA